MTVAANIAAVRGRIASACARAGRDPSDVRLVGVSKGVPVARVREALDAGLTDIGENRVQELVQKVAALPDAVRWHLVGGIQTNKVRSLDRVTLLHSVDRLREAEALHERGRATGRSWDVLVQCNVAGETAKQGVAPDDVLRFLDDLRAYPLVVVRGLMFLAPMADMQEDVRWVFASGRDLFERCRREADGFEELSMGMSDDFEVAVEEGATLVRIGRAIFRSDREE